MSLEQSFDTLAKSNEALAAANVQLAEAMKQYGGIMQAIANGNPEKIVNAHVTVAPAEKPAGTRGKKADSKPADKPATVEEDFGLGDDDGLGDDSGVKTYTAEEVRDALKAAKGRNPDALGKIFGKLGVKGFAQLEEKDYAKAVELAASIK